MKNKIRIDLSKLKNLNCGLGQVNLQMGHYLSNSSIREHLEFMVPPNFVGHFGNKVSYTTTNLWKRLIPNTKKYSLCHVTYQLSPFAVSRNTKKIITIHDLNFIYEKTPDKQKKYADRINKEIRDSDYIIYISHFVKAEVNKHFNIPKSTPQGVIYNGVTIDTEKKVYKPKYVNTKRFLFTIGEVKGKKNFAVLIDFIKELPDDISLIIAGNKSTSYAKEINEKIIKHNLQKRVSLVGIISEDEKIYLYRNCFAFVFPSLFEGFGLPIIEAMKFGKAVFLSKSTSLPEIGGSLAFYWNDFDPIEMKKVFLEKMNFYQSELNYRQKLIEHANQFSWEENISSYINIYKHFLEN